MYVEKRPRNPTLAVADDVYKTVVKVALNPAGQTILLSQEELWIWLPVRAPRPKEVRTLELSVVQTCAAKYGFFSRRYRCPEPRE